MLRRSALALLSAAVVSTALAPLPAAAAGAGRDLDLYGFRDIVVDDTHGRVFVSDYEKVVVTNLAGKPTGVIEGVKGADLALAEDDGTLIVAGLGSDAISIVDTDTLAVETIETGEGSCPARLAITAGTLWFSQGCGGAGIGAMDLVDHGVQVGVSPLSASLMTSSPARPDELFVAAGATIHALAATGGNDPTLTERATHDRNGAVDLAITPDGSRIVSTGSENSGEAVALSAEDLSPVDVYATGRRSPSAVAIRDDGMVAIGNPDNPADDVRVMPPGSTTTMRAYRWGRGVRIGGMAFGETRLYVVTENGLLQVIIPRRESKIAVRSDRKTYGHAAHAKLRVTLQAGETNRTVSVFARLRGVEEPVLVATGEVPVGGAFEPRVELTRGATFFAVYDGDDYYEPSTAHTKRVKVKADLRTKMLRSRGTAGRYHLYRVGQRAALQAKLLPKGFPNRCVTLRLQYFARGRWGYDAQTSCLTPDRRARVRGYLVGSRQLAGMPLRMRAEFRGDKVHTKTITSWSYLKFKR
ncbi:hypothetical protein [Nocardioides sp.]|uniref:hypothetical protein n=1 Tax=Nocardioides sp. TaxID=35761 RepID=UPI0035131CCA